VKRRHCDQTAATSNARPRWSRARQGLSSISTTRIPRGHHPGPLQADPATEPTALNQLHGQSLIAARAVSGLYAGQGRARGCPAQSRPDHGARADGRRRTQVDQIQLGRFVRGWHAGVQCESTSQTLARCQPEGIRLHLCRVGQPVTIDVDAFPDHVFKARRLAQPGTGAHSRSAAAERHRKTSSKVCSGWPVRIYSDANDKMCRS